MSHDLWYTKSDGYLVLVAEVLTKSGISRSLEFIVQSNASIRMNGQGLRQILEMN